MSISSVFRFDLRLKASNVTLDVAIKKSPTIPMILAILVVY